MIPFHWNTMLIQNNKIFILNFFYFKCENSCLQNVWIYKFLSMTTKQWKREDFIFGDNLGFGQFGNVFYATSKPH